MESSWSTNTKRRPLLAACGFGKEAFQRQYLRDRELTSQQIVLQDQQKHLKSNLHNEDATDDVFIGDSWFGSVATALAYAKNGAKCIMQVKTATSRYPKKFLEDHMQSWLTGSHLVSETTTPCGKKLFAVRYKYSSKKTLCFIFNKGASHTEPGKPYVAKYRDKNGNCRQQNIACPACCSQYFSVSNVIDIHNQLRQKNLWLEKHWVTQCRFFHIFNMIVGICVVNAMNVYKYHLHPLHCHKNVELLTFVNMLIEDLLNNKESKVVVQNRDRAMVIGNFGETPVKEVVTMHSFPSCTDALLALSTPTGTGSMDSFYTFSTRKFIAVNKHQIRKTERKVKEKCVKVSGHMRRTSHYWRTARGYCCECNDIGKEGKNSVVQSKKKGKNTIHCVTCVPSGKHCEYWICDKCAKTHQDRVRQEVMEGKHVV